MCVCSLSFHICKSLVDQIFSFQMFLCMKEPPSFYRVELLLGCKCSLIEVGGFNLLKSPISLVLVSSSDLRSSEVDFSRTGVCI